MSSGVLETVREDDFIEYILFPNINSEHIGIENEENILDKIAIDVNRIAEHYCRGYIWHKDGFKVTPRTRDTYILTKDDTTVKEPIPIHFHGISHYGDNIQDEWFLVSLLLHLTKEIPQLVVRVVDSDGEFLLIEAADYLPDWATPETCEQRVYLYDGAVHIIEPVKTDKIDESDNSDDEDDEIVPTITISEAIQTILTDPTKHKASESIQKSIQSRIKDFPHDISEHLHRTTVYVPIAIADILQKRPSLISAAVQAFCNRDPIDTKVCRAMKYFPPENRVYTSVLFTKCLYAMLVHCNYCPDRKIGWNLPPTHNPDHKAHLLGIKIACGFEILVSQAKPEGGIEGDKAWPLYLQSLTDKGYFQGFIEKSQSHNNLLEKAKKYYIENRDSMKFTPSIGREILELTKSAQCNLDDSSSSRTNLPPDDNENWLDISADDLDQMLQDRYGVKQKIFSTNGNADPSQFTGKLNEFLEHKSGIEGAEFPDDVDLKFDIPVRPKRGIKPNKLKHAAKSTEPTNSNVDSGKINFEPDSFSNAIQNILDLMIPEDNWNQSSDSEMSDYEDEQFSKNIEDISQDKRKKPSIQDYMDQMDKELAGTTIGKSFKLKTEEPLNDSFDEVENFNPVDIDMNALKNMMESYRAQMGSSGPVSNMLGPMGVRLEPDMEVE